jgi:hypothetical protein
MVRTCGRSTLRILVLITAVLCVWSVHAGQLHQLRAAHAVCLEHMHVIDVQADAAGYAAVSPDRAASGPIASAAIAPDDEHGCRVQVLIPLELPPITVVRHPRPLTHVAIDPLAAHEAPRGPPLDYAPKTSPPALA